MKCEMRGIKGQPTMNLTPTLDRKHGGALVHDWTDLSKYHAISEIACWSFVRLGDYENAFSTLDDIPRKPIDSEIGLTTRVQPSVR
jgi:hypothetical protein